MATFSKRILSGSTNGKGILVVQAATPGTLIHTAVSGTADIDEITLYAMNTAATQYKLTIEWGEATAPDGNIEFTVAPESGLVLAIPKLLLQNSLVVRAWAATGSVITIHGYVNRITA